MQEDVDNAAVMIEDLLQPQDETRMEHKRMQLRELAALNGTLKDEDVRVSLSLCPSCVLFSLFCVATEKVEQEPGKTKREPTRNLKASICTGMARLASVPSARPVSPVFVHSAGTGRQAQHPVLGTKLLADLCTYACTPCRDTLLCGFLLLVRSHCWVRYIKPFSLGVDSCLCSFSSVLPSRSHEFLVGVQLEQNQLAVIAGDRQQEGVYQLPTQIQSAAQEQYARDIARVHGVAVQSEESEYQDFLASLGGGGGGGRGPPPGALSVVPMH